MGKNLVLLSSHAYKFTLAFPKQTLTMGYILKTFMKKFTYCKIKIQDSWQAVLQNAWD